MILEIYLIYSGREELANRKETLSTEQRTFDHSLITDTLKLALLEGVPNGAAPPVVTTWKHLGSSGNGTKSYSLFIR